MTHGSLFLLGTLAFAALALATERQQDALFGRSLHRRPTTALRLLGWAALAAALTVAVRVQGWGIGLVSFSGYTSVGAGLVFAALIVVARLRSRRAARR